MLIEFFLNQIIRDSDTESNSVLRLFHNSVPWRARRMRYVNQRPSAHPRVVCHSPRHALKGSVVDIRWYWLFFSRQHVAAHSSEVYRLTARSLERLVRAWVDWPVTPSFKVALYQGIAGSQQMKSV